jgi:hydrogenase maturation protease
MNRILVAGIGNIFMGDDAFGSEVAQRLGRKPLPAGVKVVDFGIRGIDLTYALLDGYDAAILIDAAQRGAVPGTVSIVAPEPPATELPQPAPAPTSPFPELHDLDPAKVLRLVAALGGGCERILLVACEPETLGDEETGAMGLSAPVAAAVDEAVIVVERLIGELLDGRVRTNTGTGGLQ